MGEEPDLHNENGKKADIDSEGYRKSSEKSNFMDNVKSESNPFSIAMQSSNETQNKLQIKNNIVFNKPIIPAETDNLGFEEFENNSALRVL